MDPKQKTAKKTPTLNGSVRTLLDFARGIAESNERNEKQWKSYGDQSGRGARKRRFLKEESKLVMRKHDQQTLSVTKTLSETAQAVKLCGKERELGDQRLIGWDQVMMLKLKKELERGWCRCEHCEQTAKGWLLLVGGW